jgi:diadenosine tetraphosphatase ApaH/serine/threonine PP2A family protein phosphatase
LLLWMPTLPSSPRCGRDGLCDNMRQFCLRDGPDGRSLSVIIERHVRYDVDLGLSFIVPALLKIVTLGSLRPPKKT